MSIEKHIDAGTVLTAIMVALLTWIGWQTQQTAVAVAVLSEKILAVQNNARRIDDTERRLNELERR